MNALSFGDMAQSALLRRQNSYLKTEMSRLTQELSSGQVQDVSKHLGGDYGYLTEVERSLRVVSAFRTSATEAAIFTATMQNALGFVGDALKGMSIELIAAGTGGLSGTNEIASENARSQLGLIVSSLNANVAGRSVFAGVETGGKALGSADEMLDDLRTALTGTTTMADVEAVFDTWFATSGGGFETSTYQGSTQSLEPFFLGEGERVSLDIRADDPAVRNTLKATAMAALATDATLAFSADVKAEMLLQSGQTMLGAQDQVTTIRAKLGFAEARVEEASTRLASEDSSLDYARNQLLGADPYETITQLEETQFRLESLYAATAKMSQLSLMDYL